MLSNYAKRGLRRSIRERFKDLHAEIGKARTLRAKGTYLALEDAEGVLVMAWHEHQAVRRLIRELRQNKNELEKLYPAKG